MTVPVAAASAMYPLLTGPSATGVVIGTFSRALIIGIKAPSGPDRILSVLGPGAAGVPNGVRVPAGSVDFARFRPGDPVRVDDTMVRIAGVRLRVVRTWNSRVHRIRPATTAVQTLEAIAVSGVGGISGISGIQRGVPLEAISNLAEALAAGGGAIAPAVGALVGLGQGLTPGGDDVLAGLLVGLHACDATALARTIADHALDRVEDRTTQLSADLLRLAGGGHACVEVLALLRAVHTGHQVPAALHRLLSIGHTSGADLATGLAMGLGMGLRCGRSMSQYGEASTTIR